MKLLKFVLRWLGLRTVRQATDLRKHVLRLTRAQQDILPAEAPAALSQAAARLRTAVQSGAAKPELQKEMSRAEQAANKWLRPYPHAGIRENVDVLLVAVAVAIGIRTFFLQPMKIPTGSMQPTLYGITQVNLKGIPGAQIPDGLRRWEQSWAYGISYYHYVARSAGELRIVDPRPRLVLPLVSKQRFMVGNDLYTVWFPPEDFFRRAGVEDGQYFTNGEDIIKLKVVSGDHLFVNRFTYNFRRPRRGEIIIFETTGITNLQQNTHYIKRLVGLPGDRVQIGNDNHLIINGRRLDAATPHFEDLYTFSPRYRPNHYFGHVNGLVAARLGLPGLAPLFPDQNAVFVVGEDRYLVMGDNTMNSYDSRHWGDFPREKVIGKCGFVYWPISPRFGWAVR